ncbi:heavy-metal-associated domain-containing protein [Aspergillus affinis]|uniref:heavy-metal-associated domain-containing protein n=1 Tax=Aspergillus affinis TaxID=1070780 RepID=UPI0022FDE232|nr:heavy metal ion transporter [Aspergillus affinis]KAI9039100.1 heavy metal ion transporter [Aspergillus affinis]
MSPNQYKFNVQMGCGGCSSALEDALKSVNGIESFDVSLEHKTVLVNAESSLSYEAVLAVLKATGKAVHSGEANGQAREV